MNDKLKLTLKTLLAGVLAVAGDYIAQNINLLIPFLPPKYAMLGVLMTTGAGLYLKKPHETKQ